MNSATRKQLLHRLTHDTFDVLVIGGGATGTGIALDATTRGLKTALVEADDFSAGSSSRSTKLVHGGVRYLEQAFLHLNLKQYHLVTTALQERASFLDNAPHLTRPLPIFTPIYNWWALPYYMMGLKLYDWIAGKARLDRSYYLSKEKTLQRFPMLNKKGLHGAVAYYDGQFNDARMNVTLALTAIAHGAAAVNHLAVTQLTKEKGKVCGVQALDHLSGEMLEIQARCVINATGPFVDGIRHLDNPDATSLMAPSAGTHILLDKSYCPSLTGLLIPKTADGRVLFLLPWEGHTLVGTTEIPCEITATPKPTAEEITYLLDHLDRYLGIRVKKAEVLAAWTGLRPLVGDPHILNTAQLGRDHLIDISPSGLITIAGGKWTTYRKMAADTVDAAIELGHLHPKRPCQTATMHLVGAKGYSSLPLLIKSLPLPFDIAKHLAKSYGGCAQQIAQKGYNKRLAEGYPYIEAEVLYAVETEYACTAIDVLARRTQLAFLNNKAAQEALPTVIRLMGKALGWDAQREQEEQHNGRAFLATMK